MKLPRFIRLLIAYGLGDDDRRVPLVPDGLPPDVASTVGENVKLLTEYQDAEFARLYMSRLGRFVHRNGVDTPMLGDIARLLAPRMAYEDLIWHAQRVLGEAAAPDPDRERALSTEARADRSKPVKPTLREIVSMCPPSVAGPLIQALTVFGWTDATIAMSMTVRTWRGRLAAHAFASMRRLRPQSVRYSQERPLVERWLHMIDRALTIQPSSAREIVRSATLLSGHGLAYKCALANWNLMIDGLVKPTFDGQLALADLGEKLARVRDTAVADPSGQRVREEILKIKSGLSHAA